jgi:hypothetical protein
MSRRYDRAPLKPEQRPLLDARKPLLKDLASNADDRRDTLTAILRARSRKRPDPFLPIDLSARSPLSSPHLAPIRSSSFRMSAASRRKRFGFQPSPERLDFLDGQDPIARRSVVIRLEPGGRVRFYDVLRERPAKHRRANPPALFRFPPFALVGDGVQVRLASGQRDGVGARK